MALETKNMEQKTADRSPEDGAQDKTYDVGEVHELKKRFSRLTILSMAVVLMATWEALSSTMVSGLISGGPVSLVYGFILSACGSMATAASLAEMASMYPTAGGQYHFIAKLAPERWRHILSWSVGWTGTFGWVAFTASAPFLAAGMIQGLLVLNYETYQPERWHATLIYWALTIFSTITNIWGLFLMSFIETASLVIHVVAFVALFIVLWVCVPTMHSASFVFTLFQNNSGWLNDGVPWCIGMLSSCYVLTGYDGAIHLGEEMNNPRVEVPYCMLSSIAINGVMGFAFLLALLFCMGDMQAALNSSTGFPIIEIFRNATGSASASSAMTSMLIVTAGLATIPLLASTTRMVWSLARDKALPFSPFLSKVGTKSQLPTNSILTTGGLLILLGLINIGSTTAFNAIISLAVFGLQVSYIVPIAFMLWRRILTPAFITYGPWKLGHFGVAINIFSLIYLIFTSIFLVFPPYQPVTPVNMNYACLIFGAVLLFSGVYWVWKGRYVYEGPVMTFHDD